MAIHGKQLKAGTISKDRLNPADIMTETEYQNGTNPVLNLTDPAHESKLLEAKAIHEYVQDQVASSGYDFTVTDGTTSDTIVDSDTLAFAGTANEIDVALSVSGTTNTITIGLKDDVTIGNDLTVTGNLTVNGATTTVNTAELAVEDKNIELASGSTSDTTANGGGLTLKGANDKTFSWLNATGSWTSSEHMDLASGKEYRINGTPIVSADNLSGLNAAAVDVAVDSIAIIDADDGNGSRKESIANLATAMAGSGITATNGVLSAAAGTTPELNVVSISPDATTGGGAGNLINVSGSSYALPSTPSGEVQLFVNGIAQELGGSPSSGDYYITTSYKIEWNSSDFDLETTDKIIISYVPA